VNVALTNNQNPIFISSYYPDSTIPSNPTTDTGSAVTGTTPIWRDITISNVNAIASSGRNAGRIYGLPEMAITNLSLSKVTIKADKSFDLYHVRNAHSLTPKSMCPRYEHIQSLQCRSHSHQQRLQYQPGEDRWLEFEFDHQQTGSFQRSSSDDGHQCDASNRFACPRQHPADRHNNYVMSPSSVINFTLGSSNASVAVSGNLTLNGTLNVNAGPGFTDNTYTIFTYGNTLTWGTPVLGNVPAGHTYSLIPTPPALSGYW